MKFRWDKLGGQLGILYCVVGLFLIFLGWNGAASYDRVQAQIPYVISGGIAGLALVVIGAAMLITYGNRTDRAALQATLDDLRQTLEPVVCDNRHAEVRLLRHLRVGGDLSTRMSQCVEERRLPGVGEADDSDPERHSYVPKPARVSRAKRLT